MVFFSNKYRHIIKSKKIPLAKLVNFLIEILFFFATTCYIPPVCCSRYQLINQNSFTSANAFTLPNFQLSNFLHLSHNFISDHAPS